MNSTTALSMLLLTLGPAAAGALEISLEENRAERGNIGYVDIKALYRLYPETEKAKASFAQIVRQAEDQVNLRRAELMTLRSELAQLELERDLLAKKPLPVPEPPPAPVPPPEPEPPAPASDDAAAAEVSVSTAAAAATEGSSAAAEISTGSAALGGLPGVPPLALLPGMSERPAEKPAAINIPGMEGASAEIKAPAAASPDAAAVHSSTASIAEAFELRAARLAELDAGLKTSTAELARKEESFLEYQASVEKNLIEIEGRRTEILLGKIYRAVRSVAQDSGVSVVVDKGQILFGQDSVDLTKRVLEKLKEIPL